MMIVWFFYVILLLRITYIPLKSFLINTLSKLKSYMRVLGFLSKQKVSIPRLTLTRNSDSQEYKLKLKVTSLGKANSTFSMSRKK